jgi:hypothetical protein
MFSSVLKQRLSEVDGHFSASGISTALFLAGIIPNDLPGINPPCPQGYLANLEELENPKFGSLVAWEGTFGSQHHLYTAHLGIIVDPYNRKVLHRPKYGYYIAFKDTLENARRAAALASRLSDTDIRTTRFYRTTLSA